MSPVPPLIRSRRIHPVPALALALALFPVRGSLAATGGLAAPGNRELLEGRHAEALARYRAIVDAGGAGADWAAYASARAAWLAGDAARALDLASRHAAGYPESRWRFQAASLVVDCLIRLGRQEEAARKLGEIADRILAPERKEFLARRFLELAHRIRESQTGEDSAAISGAVELLEEALRLELPEELLHEVRLTRARDLFELDPRKAIGELEDLLTTVTDPDRGDEVRLELGRVLRMQQRQVEARQVLFEIVDRKPESRFTPDALILIAMTYGFPRPENAASLDRCNEIVQLYLERHPEHPRHGQVGVDLANALAWHGRDRRADAVLENILATSRHDPGQTAPPAAYLRLARSLRTRKKFAQARATYLQYLEAFPVQADAVRVRKELADLDFEEALHMFDQGDLAGSRESLGAFVRTYPLDHRRARVALNLAEILWRERRLPEAMEAFERITHDFDHSEEAGEARFRQGEILERDLEDPGRALEIYRSLDWGPRVEEARKRVMVLTRRDVEPEPGSVFRTGETVVIAITTRNIPRLTVETHQVDAAAYFAEAGDLDHLERIDVDLVPAAGSFEITIGDQPHAARVLHVPLPVKGPGLYLARFGHEDTWSRIPVLVSDLEVITRGSRGDVLVFARNVREEKPWPGVRILIEAGGQVVEAGVTDTRGLLRFEPPVPVTGSEILPVLALAGDHVAWVDAPVPAIEAPPSDARVLMRTDRDVYQSEETIRFQAIVREAPDGQPGGRPGFTPGAGFSLDLIAPNGRILLTRALTMSERGTLEAQIPVPVGSPDRWGEAPSIAVVPPGGGVRPGPVPASGEPGRDPGHAGASPPQTPLASPPASVPAGSPDGPHTLSLSSPGGSVYTTIVWIRGDRPSSLVAAFEPDRHFLLPGVPLTGTVRLFHPDGIPAEGIELTVSFGSEVRKAITDAGGRVSYRFGTRGFAPGELTLVVKSIPNGVLEIHPLTILKEPLSLSLIPEKRLLMEGDEALLSIRALDARGWSVSLPLTLTVERIGPGESPTDRPRIDQMIPVTTDAAGMAQLRLAAPARGAIRLTLSGRDERGRLVHTRSGFDVTGPADGPSLRIAAPAGPIVVGRRVRFPVIHWGPRLLALAVLESGRILDHQVIELQPGLNQVEWDIADRHGPGCRMWIGTTSAHRLLTADLAFDVTSELVLHLEPDRDRYAPGDPVTVTVTSVDQLGEPVPALLGFGVLEGGGGPGHPTGPSSPPAAGPDPAPEPLATATSAVRTFESWMRPAAAVPTPTPTPSPETAAGTVAPAPSLPPDRAPVPGPVPSSPPPSRPPPPPFPVPPSAAAPIPPPGGPTPSASPTFTRTLHWETGLEIGPTGARTFRFRLPEQPGTFRVMVWGVDGAHRIGTGHLSLEVARPLTVLIDTPSHPVAGDQIRFPVWLLSQAEVSQDVTLGLDVHAPGVATAPVTATVVLPPGARQRIELPIVIPPTGLLRLAARARSSMGHDRHRRDLEVGRPAWTRRVVALGRTGLTTTTLDLGEPPPAGGRVEVEVYPELARWIGSDPLLTSRNPSSLSAKLRLMLVLGRRAPDPSVKADIDQLMARIETTPCEDLVELAFRLDAVWKASLRGVPGAEALIPKLVGLLQERYASAPDRERPFILHALAGPQACDLNQIDHYSRYEPGSTLYRALLVLARVRMGRSDPSDHALELLERAWTGSGEPDETFGGDVIHDAGLERALAVQALRAAGRSGSTLDAGIRAMFDTLGRLMPASPHARATAAEVLADLTEPAPAGGPADGGRSIEVRLGGRTVGVLETFPTTSAERIDIEALPPDPGPVRVELLPAGPVPVFYRATLTAPEPVDTPRSDGVHVIRNYRLAPLLLDGREVPPGSDRVMDGYPWLHEAVGQITTGEALDAIVRFRLLHPPHLEYLEVEEALPAGTTLLPGSVRGNFTHLEIAGIGLRALYLLDARTEGILSYRLVGRHPGSFRARPTRVRSLSTPGREGQGRATRLEVLASHESRSTPRRMSPNELWAFGRDAFERRRWDAAERLLGSLDDLPLRADSEREIHRMLLQIALETGRAGRVKSHHEELAARFPDTTVSFEDLRRIAAAYATLGDPEAALRTYRGLLLGRFLVEAQLAGAFLRQGDSKGCEQILSTLHDEYPDLPVIRSSRLALAESLVARGQEQDPSWIPRGVASLEDFLLTAPESHLADRAAFLLASVHIEQGALEPAFELARYGSRAYPDSRYADAFHYIQALCLFRKGEDRSALRALRDIAKPRFQDGGSVEVSDYRPMAMYLTARIQHASGQIDEALTGYRMVENRFEDARDSADELERVEIGLDRLTRINPGFPAQLELRSRNLEALALTVHPVNLMRLAERSNGLRDLDAIRLAGIPPVHRATIRVARSRTGTVDLTPVVLPLNSEGAYFVSVRSGPAVATGLLLVSGLQVEAVRLPGRSSLRIHLKNQFDKPIAGARALVLEAGSDRVIQGGTDRRGLFVAPDLPGSATIVARSGNAYAYAHSGGERAVEHAPVGTGPVPTSMETQLLSRVSADASRLAAEGETFLEQTIFGLRRHGLALRDLR